VKLEQPQSDLPDRHLAREVAAADRLVAVYCGHHGHRGRRLVAVVTKSGRLLTCSSAVSWAKPPSDDIRASCDRCRLAVSEHGGPVMCFRILSVEKLRAHVRSGHRVVELDQILSEKQLALRSSSS